MIVDVRALALAAVAAVCACAPSASPHDAPALATGVGALRHAGTHVLAVPAPRVLGMLRKTDGAYVAPWGRGTATLTLDAPLHDALSADLRVGRPQWGATVIVDVKSGKVLALAEASEREPGIAGAATRPLAQAASVFKLVTASALVRAGVPLSKEVCFSGGKTRMKMQNLLAEGGSRCVTFEDVVPYSANVAMAKLAGLYLKPALLEQEAERFGFGKELTVDLEVGPSSTVIPGDPFGFASVAAGFGEVRLSALHGAAMAAMIGNGGVLIPPRIIASVAGESMPTPRGAERVLDEQHAALLQAMMSAVVSRGTAHAAFQGTRWSPYGRPAAVDVPVAGKTGSLTDRAADLDTTWFVGTAPAHDPTIAIATVIINDEWMWHVRALDVATRAVATYFRLHPDDARASEPVARVGDP
jgi:cell division protein FtsI/penicillin-binding protein 2